MPPDTDFDPTQAINAVQIVVENQVAPVRAALERLYSLVRHLHPEKKFMAAVDAVNKEAQEAAKEQQDPRLSELQAEVQSLKDGLPAAIAASMKGLIVDMREMIQKEMQTTPAPIGDDNEEMDFGEPDVKG